MNIIEQLQSLDTNDIGRWPLLFRAVLIAVIFVAVSVGGSYYFVYRTKALLLEQAEAKEIELKATFVAKQKRAANLDAYKVQLKEMEVSFGAMLRQLPSRTEVPSLLVDISQTGLAAGLEERLFQPSSEIKKDFYAELPIKIRLQGSYHDLAQFVSGIAALPRIVTLHDVLIQPEKNTGGNDLMLDVTAKTYRYLEEES
ncbi:MAG: pilus assembly protein PilO [Gammaproteobacteria bacterium]|nr:type 4a pilus biogenesis protein PilO [Pseudomonadota bacterium]TDJ13400.1 MAG: pilus assembly protein PilO [Gammaproteobacteria bacterium]